MDNLMTTKHLAEASRVFNGDLDRWIALHEIQQHIPQIKDQWLAAGAHALRAHFDVHPCPGWKCEPWGKDERDTKWYLEDEPADKTIGICLGWELELHVADIAENQQVRRKAQQEMEDERFEPLNSLLKGSPTTSRKEQKAQIDAGSIHSNPDFDPFDSKGERELRKRIIAWHAMHNTNEFVKKTAGEIRKILNAPPTRPLIRELNALCRGPAR